MKMSAAFARCGASVQLIHPQRAATPWMRGIDDLWTYYQVPRTFRVTPLPSLDLAWLPTAFGRAGERGRFWLQLGSYMLSAAVWMARLDAGSDTIVYGRDLTTLAVVAPMVNRSRWPIFYEAHTFPRWRRHTSLVARFHGIIAITHHLKKLYVDAGIPADRILVASDGVDLEAFDRRVDSADARRRLGLSNDRPVVCYTGHLYGWKGVDTLIRSARYLGSEVLISIVGGVEPDLGRVRALARAEGASYVRLEGFVPPAAVADYLFAADVLVLPNTATEPISAYYTSPLKLFEYMAARRPIVASAVPSLREVLRHEHNAVLVHPDDPQALAQGIRRTLSDARLSARIASQAYADVQEFTWEKRAQRILAFARERAVASELRPAQSR